jgi:hypothetical protein
MLPNQSHIASAFCLRLPGFRLLDLTRIWILTDRMVCQGVGKKKKKKKKLDWEREIDAAKFNGILDFCPFHEHGRALKPRGLRFGGVKGGKNEK